MSIIERRKIALVLFALFLAIGLIGRGQKGYAQTIHQSELGRFVGKIVPSNTDNYHSQNPFISYALEDLTKPSLIFKLFPLSEEDYRNGVRVVGLHPSFVAHSWRQGRTSVSIPYRDLVVAVLAVLDYDKSAGGFLSFWQVIGDSLEFKFLDDMQLWGTETIEYRVLPDSSTLLALNYWDGDGGDYWVGYRFLRYNGKDEVELIYKKDYEYSDFYDHIKPSYSLLNDETLIVRIIERHFTGMFDETGNPLPKEEENKFVRADTFYVDLWKLVTERSDK